MSMLSKLLTVGKQHYDFYEYEIKDIEKSCCKTQTCKMIDFDKVKEKVVSMHGLQTVLNSSSFSTTKKEYESFKSLQKRYFIVTDIRLERNAVENILFTLDFLAETSNIDKTIKICLQEKVDEVDVCYLSEKPRLVDCTQICEIISKKGV
jgi:hypothetical protein